jgi:6-phosphogluconolactonase
VGHKSFPHRAAAAAGAGLLATAIMSATQASAGPTTVVTGDQVYVTNSALQSDPGSATVARFGVDPAGLLAPAETEPAGDGARRMVFTPRANANGKRFAFVSSTNTKDAGSIDRYLVDASGELTMLDRQDAEHPFGMAIHPNGGTIYVSSFENDSGAKGLITPYRVGPEGTLTPLNPVDSGTIHPKGVAVTPDGRFLYVSHGSTTDPPPSVLIGFAIAADGSLVPGPVDTEPLGANGSTIAITPNGQFIYTSSMENTVGTPDVFGFRIDPTGRLSPVPGTGFETGRFVEGIAISPDGTRLYTAALGNVGTERDGELHAFTIDPTGRLIDIGLTKFGLDPIALVFSRDGRRLYVSDFSGHTISTFQVDAAGTLQHRQTLDSGGRNPAFQSVTLQPAQIP